MQVLDDQGLRVGHVFCYGSFLSLLGLIDLLVCISAVTDAPVRVMSKYRSPFSVQSIFSF